jgi:hypothetical protein
LLRLCILNFSSLIFFLNKRVIITGGGADPMDVKARLKVWAQAVALASTTHLTS